MAPIADTPDLEILFTQWRGATIAYEQALRRADDIWNTSPAWYRRPGLRKSDSQYAIAIFDQHRIQGLAPTQHRSLRRILSDFFENEITTHAQRCAAWEVASSYATANDEVERRQEHLARILEHITSTPARNLRDIHIKLHILAAEISIENSNNYIAPSPILLLTDIQNGVNYL